MNRKNVETSHGSIQYIDSEGSGPSVLFIHGNSLNAALFKPLIDSSLARKYRLVALDLPGHGESPRTDHPARDYGLAAYASLTRELAGELSLNVPVLFGHSLGGHIALQALAGGMEGRGLFIVGTPPLGAPPDFSAAFTPSAAGDWVFRGKLTAGEVEAVAATLMPPNIPVPPELVRAIAATDPRARRELGIALDRDKLQDEVAFLASWHRPVGIALGEHDSEVRRSYIEGLSIPSLWLASIQTIPGAGHCPQIDAPERLMEMFGEYLDGLAP